MGVEVAGHPKPPKEDNDIDWGKADVTTAAATPPPPKPDNDIDWGPSGKRFDFLVPGGCQIPRYVKPRLNHPGRNGW